MALTFFIRLLGSTYPFSVSVVSQFCERPESVLLFTIYGSLAHDPWRFGTDRS